MLGITYVLSTVARLVAQIFNLPYRRIYRVTGKVVPPLPGSKPLLELVTVAV